MARLSLRNRVKSSVIWGELEVELLHLGIKMSQLRWVGYLIRMPPRHLPLEVFMARPTQSSLWAGPRTRWRDYISWLTCEDLVVPQKEPENFTVEKEAFNTLLTLLPLRPNQGLAEENGQLDGSLLLV